MHYIFIASFGIHLWAGLHRWHMHAWDSGLLPAQTSPLALLSYTTAHK
jgi:hypothetical protein